MEGVAIETSFRRVISEANKTISVTLPYGSSLTSLSPTFSITGAFESPLSGASMDFTNPVTYWVIAADGTAQAYVVTVSVAKNSAKAITSCDLSGWTGTISGTSISVPIYIGTDITNLIATFITTGSSVKVGSTVQISGSTTNNFTTPVTYTVTAEDGSEQNYIVTVTVTNPFTVSGNTITGLTNCTRTNLVVPSSIDGVTITSIASKAFQDAPTRNFTIPSSVTSIGFSNFLCRYGHSVNVVMQSETPPSTPDGSPFNGSASYFTFHVPDSAAVTNYTNAGWDAWGSITTP